MENVKNREIVVAMQHSADTIGRLSKMQWDLFGTVQKLVLLAVAVLCFALSSGLVGSAGPAAADVIFLACGTFLLLSVGYIPKYNAQKLIRSIRESKKGFPISRFRFRGDRMIVEDAGELPVPATGIRYVELCRLAEDDRNYFLFPSRCGGYVIPKEDLSDSERAELKRRVESGSGRSFRRRGLLFGWLPQRLHGRG